ncbi:leucine-rich repeat-containing protein 46 [Podarcis lilfordi]|uniref:Leucine-rich repeat-containing protein 46 n=1 Tax=Podarcis lilfordi TaxID=74358 RepID=A0AA35PLE4_9SAUR|nr:leucine-rich repeat-containing protein 46 [Podarcis lilfordi]
MMSGGGVSMTKSLIAQRNLNFPVEKESPESISQALTSLHTLRLDRERISCIANLQGLEQVHSLYLQQNQIEKIENLSCFPDLTFLTLAGNRISQVENLHTLPKLQFLDLSQNRIETLDTVCIYSHQLPRFCLTFCTDELPRSLVILDLTGNECTKQNNYRERVLAALPHLKELDTQGVWKDTVQTEEEEEDSSEDSDEDWSDLAIPLSVEKDFFADLREELGAHSAQRREEEAREYEDRLEELRQMQNLRALVFNTSERPPWPFGVLEIISAAPEGSVLQSEYPHHPPSNLSKTANPTPKKGPRAPKGKAGGSSPTQLKASKGEGSGVMKTTSKGVKK